MVDILIVLLSLVLLLTAFGLIFLVLMQRASTDGGMGTAFGGGVTESAFGADTGNVLTRFTRYAVVLFFVLSFVLYLLYIKDHQPEVSDAALPSFVEETSNEAVVPATTSGEEGLVPESTTSEELSTTISNGEASAEETPSEVSE